jgi:hypothetical protein
MGWGGMLMFMDLCTRMKYPQVSQYIYMWVWRQSHKTPAPQDVFKNLQELLEQENEHDAWQE